MSEDQFFEWANKRSKLPLAVRGHSLMMKGDNIITIDGGVFVYEEALETVRMLNSRSPFAQMSATFRIWERNGTMRFVALALIAFILIVVLVLARR